MYTIRFCARFLVTPAALLMIAASVLAQTYDDPGKTDDDFPFQGEYVGQTKETGEKWGAQVIALGGGQFRLVGHKGGLPGFGWDSSDRVQTDGKREGDTLTFKHDTLAVVLKDGTLTVKTPEGVEAASLKKTERKSDTLGAKPPAGAVVLFAGKESAGEWIGVDGKKARVTDDGLLMEGHNTVKKFQNGTLHVEFRLPYMPKAKGQGRGNSGVYLQGRYEVQVLDSFGLTGEHNECGGIYTLHKPAINMCFPPLAWQTYDIDYTAAKFGTDGKKSASARMTVRHNGVVIHDNVELSKTTTAAPNAEGSDPGFIHLQQHGNPVRYRNIWWQAK